MNRLTIFLLGLMIMSVTNVFAEGTMSGAATGEVMEEKIAPVEVNNKICPVSGEEVGTMGDVVKIEYNGKIYNLCCPMCEKEFMKDPDKYAAIAEAEVMAEEDTATEEMHEHMHDHAH